MDVKGAGLSRPDMLVAETRAIWNQLAGWWDDRIADEGSAFSRDLLVPATERLLDARPGERVLDVACGNGWFSRRVSRRGAEVVAFDFSEAFIERARARTSAADGCITFRVLDATDSAQLLELGEGVFDAGVSTMALMDIATIEPLMASLHRLLRPGGRFVFSILHPGAALAGIGEAELPDLKVRPTYLKDRPAYPEASGPIGRPAIGLSGQPIPHYDFPRPLGSILDVAFRHRFVLDGMEEPRFADLPEARRPAAWPRHDVPPFLVARLRLL